MLQRNKKKKTEETILKHLKIQIHKTANKA